MSHQPGLRPVDEATLANDVVRLLGGENQRLKRELQEAQQRAKAAEARATELEARAFVKTEPADSAQELAAVERMEHLRRDVETLRTQYQDLESKYDKEKEKRKQQRARLRELKSGDSRTNVEDSPEYIELRRRQEESRSQLCEANKKVTGLSQRLDQLKNDFEAGKRLLEDANSKITSLNHNDPWAYIDSAYDRVRFDGPACVKPFRTSTRESLAAFNTFCNNTLKPRGLARIPFVHHSPGVLWSETSPGYGVTIGPPYRYVANANSTHTWTPDNCPRVIEGRFELVYRNRGFWYYCGTFTTSIIRTQGNGPLFQALDHKLQEQLMKATIADRDLLPPIIEKTIKSMYLQGVLPVVCLVFERVDFNEELYKALLEYGKDIKGNELPLYRVNRERKRHVDQVVKLECPTDKRARRGTIQEGPSRSFEV